VSAHGHSVTGSIAAPRTAAPGWVGGLERLSNAVNRLIAIAAGAAIVLAGLVLTHEIMERYILPAPADWQDETAIFLLVGATFLSAAWVQSARGHVAIDAVAGLLPPGLERARRFMVDLASMAFCAFFTWKSATLLMEAWEDGVVTHSSWAPPLWIPYLAMTVGMGLLVLQLALQSLLHLVPSDRPGDRR